MSAAHASESVQAAFGLFDDDSSDDEQLEHEQQQPTSSSSNGGLVLEALHIAPPPAPIATSKASASDFDNPDDVPSLYAPWDDVKPLSVGPIELVRDCKNIGGSRGYVAA